MLSRKYRMVDAGDFSRTLRSGSRGSNRFLVVTIAVSMPGTAILHAGSAAGSPVRVGFIVAKRQIPLAVDRGRVKRQLRHLMRDRLDQFPLGTTIVIRVLSAASGLKSDDLARRLDQALRDASRRGITKGGLGS